MEFPQTYDSLLRWARTVVPGTQVVIYKGMLGGSVKDDVSHEEFYGTIDRTNDDCFPLNAIVQKIETKANPYEIQINIWIGPRIRDEFNPGAPYLLKIYFHPTYAGQRLARSWTLELTHVNVNNSVVHRLMTCVTSFFNRESLTVISLPPFIKDVVTRATARAYNAERAAFCDTLATHGAVPRGMAADLALMMFPE
jgi:hypothetical protein